MVHPYEDTSHLPEEVQKEMRQKPRVSDDTKVLDVIRRASDDLGSATIDRIIAGMWVEYQLRTSRRYITTKLYRMKRKGYIKSVGEGEYMPAGEAADPAPRAKSGSAPRKRKRAAQQKAEAQ